MNAHDETKANRSSAWVSAFLDALPMEARTLFAFHPTHAAQLEELVHTAQASWPTLGLDPTQFLQWLAHHAAQPGFSLGTAQLHAADLWLFVACALGLEEARGQLALRHGVSVAADLKTLGIGDEASGSLVNHVLAASDTQPFTGQVALDSWLRVVTCRHVVDANPLEPVPSLDPAHLDAWLLAQPNSAPVLAPQVPSLSRALMDVLQELEPSDRNLLNHYLLDHLSHRDLALLRGKTSAWSVQRLDAIRDQLQTRWKASVTRMLDTQPETPLVSSVLGAWDVCVGRALTWMLGQHPGHQEPCPLPHQFIQQLGAI